MCLFLGVVVNYFVIFMRLCDLKGVINLFIPVFPIIPITSAISVISVFLIFFVYSIISAYIRFFAVHHNWQVRAWHRE